MAATNRAKGAEKTPAWATKGNIRLAFIPGGPSHALTLLDSGSWQRDPAILHEAFMRYGPELLDELLARKINTIVLTWNTGLSEKSSAAQRLVLAKLLPLLKKKKKIRTLASLSYDIAWKEDVAAFMPQALQWIVNTDGWSAACCAEKNIPDVCLSMDTTVPEWRKFVCADAAAAIAAGFDGLYLEGIPDAHHTPDFFKEIKLAVGKNDVLICTNSTYFSTLHAVCNLKLRRTCFPPSFDSTQNRILSNLSHLKLFYEDGGRDKKIFSELLHPSHANERNLALATAEILACGAICCDERTPQRYSDFAAKHADFYSGDPVNNVGILVNDAGCVAHNIHDAGHFLNALAQANVQFDVIPVAQLEGLDLRKYRVLDIQHLRELDEKTRDTLNFFAQEHGGTLLASSATGCTCGAWLTPVSGQNREEIPLGKGRVIYYSHPARRAEDFGTLDQAPDAALIATIAADLILLGDNPIQCVAPAGVVCLLWGKGTRRWVHVLNYTAQAVDALITLPDCGGRKLFVHSPDTAVPELELKESGTAKAVFSLKNIDLYAVVEVV